MVRREPLAARLRVLRARLGLSMTDAAELAGVQRQTLARLERGEAKPHDYTLSKIAGAYGVDVADLLTDEEPAPLSPETPLAPQLTWEQFARHGVEPTEAEISTVNQLLREYARIATTGEKKGRIIIEEGPVDLERAYLLIDYALMKNILTPEDVAILSRGVEGRLASSAGTA
jgi:transcriptional regulator with XRE-family HTH domain